MKQTPSEVGHEAIKDIWDCGLFQKLKTKRISGTSSDRCIFVDESYFSNSGKGDAVVELSVELFMDGINQ